MKKELADKLYDARPHPKTHCIIAAMLGRTPKTPQVFTSKAIVTSDGFVQANFVDGDGVMHHSAFVGSFEELEDNLHHVGDAVGVDRSDVDALIASWIAVDYR